jgi:competence protein ComEA
MKKPKVHILVALTLAFAAFTAGLYLGRSAEASPVTVSVSAAMQTLPPETTQPPDEPTEETEAIRFPIHINLAGKEEFMALPGIGEVLAQRILDYRAEHGPFRYPEELIYVPGIGEDTLAGLLDLITAGGE